MPIIIVRKPSKPVGEASEGITSSDPVKAVHGLPKAFLPPEKEFIPNVLIPCKYCGQLYISGGCNFERQKTCGNHPPGKKRKIATKSLD
jgi:hypothetical protein